MRRSYAGDQNPNFKNAGWKICCGCKKEFHHYNKTRKYCSSVCYVTDQKNRIAAMAIAASHAPRKPREKLGYKCICCVCKINFRSFVKTKYCNEHKEQAKINQVAKIKIGKTANPLNKLTKICLNCNQTFEHYKSTNRIYCSYDCHIASGGAWRAGMAAAGATMKYGAKKDANHNEIVAALQQAGAYVLDMSHVGRGFPDLIVGFRSQTILVEIKNPKTSYGKKGLNKNQLKWKESWTGGAYCVVDSIDAALRAIGAIKETL